MVILKERRRCNIRESHGLGVCWWLLIMPYKTLTVLHSMFAVNNVIYIITTKNMAEFLGSQQNYVRNTCLH